MEEPKQGQSKLSNYEKSQFITRMIGKKGSAQKSLRAELYKTAFERMDQGLKSGDFYQVICLAESIMADRINALIQCIRIEEDDHWTQGSLLEFIRILRKEIKMGEWDRSVVWDSKFEEVLQTLESDWIKGRNRVVPWICPCNT